MSRGESTDLLEDSCSQNTLKNERLEHLRYRQERNFTDRERLSGETQQGQETRCPLIIGVGRYIY
jgi:hypothetical protein